MAKKIRNMPWARWLRDVCLTVGAWGWQAGRVALWSRCLAVLLALALTWGVISDAVSLLRTRWDGRGHPTS